MTYHILWILTLWLMFNIAFVVALMPRRGRA